MATASIDSLLIEGATVVTSSDMQVMKQQAPRAKRGFVNVCSLPNGINTTPGKPGMASHQ